MKVGDVVKYRSPLLGPFDRDQVMLVVEKGVYVGRRDIKLICDDGNIKVTNSTKLRVIDEGR